MSRIGKLHIQIPAGVTVEFNNKAVTVKGPKGALSQMINDNRIGVKIENGILEVTRASEAKEVKAMHGLYRQLINNMVTGVVTPFKKIVNVQGVGYKASMQGGKLVMNIGYSHPVEYVPPQGITVQVLEPKTVNSVAVTPIAVSGISKELVGQVAAIIKSKRPVEPYHNYGLHYEGERLVKKEGKTAGK